MAQKYSTMETLMKINRILDGSTPAQQTYILLKVAELLCLPVVKKEPSNLTKN